MGGYEEGYMVHVYPTGSRYEGYWKDGRKHGKGTHTYAEGGKYVGEFYDDRRHGKGLYVYPDGGRYEGEFRSGRREGYGIYEYAQGSRYEGSWLRDKMHGIGKYIYASGNYYEGEWQEDLPHGVGKLMNNGTLSEVKHEHGKITDRQVISATKSPAAGQTHMMGDAVRAAPPAAAPPLQAAAPNSADGSQATGSSFAQRFAEFKMAEDVPAGNDQEQYPVTNGGPSSMQVQDATPKEEPNWFQKTFLCGTICGMPLNDDWNNSTIENKQGAYTQPKNQH